jgi:hypothetical protein
MTSTANNLITNSDLRLSSFIEGGLDGGILPPTLEQFKPLTVSEYNKKVEEEKNNLCNLVDKITYLKPEDLNKPRIEDLQRFFRSLTPNNYYTYMLYLQTCKVLNEEEKSYYTNIVKELIHSEQNELKKNPFSLKEKAFSEKE